MHTRPGDQQAWCKHGFTGPERSPTSPLCEQRLATRTWAGVVVGATARGDLQSMKSASLECTGTSRYAFQTNGPNSIISSIPHLIGIPGQLHV